MSWLTNFVLPKIRALTRKDVPENLWKKCPGCDQMLFHRELAANFEVCRNCGHHFRLGAVDRFKMLFDRSVFERVELPTDLAQKTQDSNTKAQLEILSDHMKAMLESAKLQVSREQNASRERIEGAKLDQKKLEVQQASLVHPLAAPVAQTFGRVL